MANKNPEKNMVGQVPPKSEVENSMKRRTLLLGVGFCLFVFCLLVPNLAKIQIRDYEEYKLRAENLQLRDTTISANRGTIYDANMKPLAISATVWTVYISPKEIAEEDHAQVAKGLSEILDVEQSVIYEKLAKTNSYYETIRAKVEKPLADSVREFYTENKISGIHLVQDSTRYYPYGDFASSVLGFVGSDNQGLAGIEAYYNDELSGNPGRIVSAKNAWGGDMPYEYEAMYEAQDGYNLVLTIDEVIQHYVEKYLAAAVEEHGADQRGVAIAMDANTGAIYAMATLPAYDPNDPFTLTDQSLMDAINQLEGEERADALNEARNEQWRNKAVSDLYEPGSVFKIVTAAAALDAGVINENTTYNCSGSINVSGTVMRCAHTAGHGTLTTRGALINSCNPSFIQIGAALGKETFSDYVKAFGLSELTGIDLPGEAVGLVVQPENMGPVELASCSFGQSNKVTAIEMITAVCAAVNGGNLLTPHIVSQIIDNDGNVVYTADTTPRRQVISQEASTMVASIMEEAVEPGNPCNRAAVLGYRVGGKSGTSQKLDTGNLDLRIASFVGIAPANDPQIVVLVILDEPNSPTGNAYGGVLCAPVVGSVIAEALPYLGVAAQYSESELANMERAVPNVVTKSLNDAQVALQKQGLTYTIKGDGNTVVSQYPASGRLSVGSTVVLYTENTGNASTSVPNFIGKDYDVAVQMAASAGLNVKEAGSNTQAGSVRVISQSIDAGSEVALGSVITLDFLDTSIND